MARGRETTWSTPAYAGRMSPTVIECPICSRIMADEEELRQHFRDSHSDQEPPPST